VQALHQFRPSRDRSAVGQLKREHLRIAVNLFRHFLFTASRARRVFFLKTIWQVMRSKPSAEKLINALAWMAGQKHFHEYVTAAHGDPETVEAVSPFTETSPALDWWEGEFNEAYVQKLKRELYAGAETLAGLGRRLRHAVAVPEAFLEDKVGECLRRYLNELGVEVVPVATAALSRLRDRADVFVLPILGKMRKGREELHQAMQQLQERLHTELDKIPTVIRLPLDEDGKAVFDAFARIGLTFTQRIDRLRQAYRKAASAVEGLSGQSDTPGGLVQAS
jgi:hypothetical protein